MSKKSPFIKNHNAFKKKVGVVRDVLSQTFLWSGNFRVARQIDPQVGLGQLAL